MKCPNCLTTMRCISAINPVPGQPGRERMDLHCVKPNGLGRGCNAICHMGVITEDPKVWECHEYGFKFSYNGTSYVLRSQNHSVDNYHQGYREPQTLLRDLSLWKFDDSIIKLPYFIPISTGDDMHERAWELFHRLRNLVAFTWCTKSYLPPQKEIRCFLTTVLTGVLKANRNIIARNYFLPIPAA